MPAYDSNLFNPPAPLVRVVLRHRSSGVTVSDVPMLLDTGADVILLPHAFVERLGVSVTPGEGYELVGFDGRVSVAQSVEVDLVFLRRAFKGRFLLINQEWGLVGRDVLNHVSLLFDGPRLDWREEK
ncbi:MAG TPA: aspartyl protease family protein [Pyrinomonadaceae bacterium]|nr:aspartyl protease family protein [Pyrinomonadaceae bacterium]